MYNAPYIILDCETGGIDPEKNPLTEFACIVVDHQLKEIERFETYIKPYNDLKIEQQALQYTGITMQNLDSGVELKSFVKQFQDLCKRVKPKGKGKNPVVVGHNVSFDIGFINKAFNLRNQELYKSIAKFQIDTIALSKVSWREELTADSGSLKLKDCCERADIVLMDAHSAMGDTEATLELFRYFSEKLSNDFNSVGSEKDRDNSKPQEKQRLYFQL